jgi:Ca-activated chloride channel homolog
MIRVTMLTPVLAFILTTGQVTIPVRPAKPLFQSEERPRRPADIAFDPATRTVTVTLSVQDRNGYFIPNLHPENFAVYEDGVRQSTATVDVEHAHVTLAVLFERGGRYQELNKLLSSEIPYDAHPLLDALQHEDTVGVFSYADNVQTLAAFAPPARDTLDPLFRRAGTAGFAEANLFDAIDDVLDRMRPVAGRKAVLLISTGLDTFSRVTVQDVLAAAGSSATPIYSLSLAGVVERSLIGSAGPLTKIDWRGASRRLEALSKASGGRTYLRDIELNVPAIYDDVMEHLRVRYVVRYISPISSSRGTARTVRVALVDPRTGAPLKITDASGKTVVANLSLQTTYTP